MSERSLAPSRPNSDLVKQGVERSGGISPSVRQVAFAKGEAIRMGLDASKEQLPARWQAILRSK